MNSRRIAKYRMLKTRRWGLRHKKQLLIIGDLLLVLLIVWQLWPVSGSEIRRDQVDMQVESYYEVSADGHPVFFFSDINDTLEASGGSVSDSTIVTHKTETTGFWVNKLPFIPSCLGHIITTTAPKANNIVKMDSTQLRRFIFRQSILSDNRLAGLQRMQNELHYYVRKHDIADYGYTQITKYSAVIDKQVDSLSRIVDTLQSIDRNAHITIRYITRYAVLKATNSNDTINRLCRIDKVYNGQFCLVQMVNRTTPLFITPRMSVTRGMEELTKRSTPALLKKEGAADASAKNTKGKTGTLFIDSVGTYVGQFNTDSITLLTKEGRGGSSLTKEGRGGSSGLPEGLGKMYYTDGSYYEGYWKNGKRNGFGFYVSPHDYLQAGTWKNDVFKGERLTYNSSRIYGIDLSRHQHERDGKKYSIDWSNLRITSLGSDTKKEVQGKVDYPVSFIYVKSTEGCTVFNNYYGHDYAMARSKGIRVGSYHFFSTTSPGYKQAWYFISKTKFNKGDLAPVLDVEPNDWQVKVMGGANVLLANVRQWLQIVYKQTGQRPILYVGQTFAHKYLTHAADITGNYLVWVARYGEYQPNWKLAIWQLSPDGRVNGIHGNVDINVFSGYRQEYDEFLKAHTIK